jgi:predicted RNase H-like HicB family nuclease
MTGVAALDGSGRGDRQVPATPMTEEIMDKKLTLIYWQGDRYWLGKLLEHPEIMTQGETLEELEENIKDAYLLMALDEVPSGYEMKEIAL